MGLQRRMWVVDCDNTRDQATDIGLRIAFATTDMKRVNQHFGSAQSFAIFSVDPERASLLEAAQFGKLEQGAEEDKLSAKLNLLQGCSAIYCQAVGSSAVRQLLAYGIQPVKVSEGVEIFDLIGSLQDEMRAGPSSWLAKAIARQKSPEMNRFDAMEAEGWDE
jgi:nitrogen fixation protein NifX